MTTKVLEKLLGFLFWIVVIASIVFLVYLQKDEADVLLNAAPGDDRITGTVTFEGERLSGGIIGLSIADAQFIRVLQEGDRQREPVVEIRISSDSRCQSLLEMTVEDALGQLAAPRRSVSERLRFV